MREISPDSCGTDLITVPVGKRFLKGAFLALRSNNDLYQK
jgi:hypothetical protein